MSWSLDGRPLRRVLVTRLRYLGDVAMSTVVLEVLRRGDPGLEIEYLCDASHAAILADHPQLQAVHALAVRRHGSDAAARRAAAAATVGGTRGTVGTVMALRARGFDLAIDLFFNPRSAWLLWLAGIPRRIGGTGSRSRGRLYTHIALARTPAEAPQLHALAGGALADHLSRLAPLRAPDGRPFLRWLEEELRPGELAPRVARPTASPAVAALLSEHLDAGDDYTLLAPAATWPTKAWPVEHWRELVQRLLAAGQRPLVLSPPGGAGPYAPLAELIPRGRGGLLPPLPLGDALAVVGRAGRLVSVDGGIMHAGVAMQVPTVGLFGPTRTEIWFPYETLGPYRVLATRPHCHPCDLHECDAFVCLPELRPAAVVDALDGLVGAREGGA